jgi:hypothetical protein
MLQAHSLLWHYLWIAPHALQVALGIFLWHSGLSRKFPAFFTFSLIDGFAQLILYAADVAPFISAPAYWNLDSGVLILEGMLKAAVIAEIFAYALGSYESLARLGKRLIQAAGVVLVLAAAVAAAYAPKSDSQGLVFNNFLLEQTIYLVESGLLVSIFLPCYYFRLSWGRQIFGIALGLGISSCVHLATWALIANGAFSPAKRDSLVFLNMGTYHFCVLLWFYFILVPRELKIEAPIPIPESQLSVWNRELERLLQP